MQPGADKRPEALGFQSFLWVATWSPAQGEDRGTSPYRATGRPTVFTPAGLVQGGRGEGNTKVNPAAYRACRRAISKKAGAQDMVP